MVTFNSFNINSFIDTDIFTVLVEISGETQLIKARKSLLTARLEFENLVSQFIGAPVPCRIRFSQTEDTWCNIDNEIKYFDVYVEFRNFAYEDKKSQNQSVI